MSCCAISTSSPVSTTTGELRLSPTGSRFGEESSSLSTPPLSRPSTQEAACGATSGARSARPSASLAQTRSAPTRAHACSEVPPRCARLRGRRTLERRGCPVRPSSVPLPSPVRAAPPAAQQHCSVGAAVVRTTRLRSRQVLRSLVVVAAPSWHRQRRWPPPRPERRARRAPTRQPAACQSTGGTLTWHLGVGL